MARLKERNERRRKKHPNRAEPIVDDPYAALLGVFAAMGIDKRAFEDQYYWQELQPILDTQYVEYDVDEKETDSGPAPEPIDWDYFKDKPEYWGQ